MADFRWSDDFQTGGEMHAVQKAADGLRLVAHPAVRFNQSGGFLLAGEPLEPPWTLEMLIRRYDSSAISAAILDGWGGPSPQASVRLEQYNNTNRVGYTLYSVADWVSSYTVPVNSLIHLAFIALPNPDLKLRVYADFAQVWELVLSPRVPVLPRYRFGWSGSTTAQRLNAVLYEVRVWQQVRSLEAMQADRWRHLHAETAGLLHYWRFGEGSGSVIADLVSGLNGTMEGTVAWVTEPKSFGHREVVVDLSAVGVVQFSQIAWQSTEPAGTGVTIETNLSLDGGATWQGWQVCTNGAPIPGITPGTNLANACLKVWEHLHTTDPSAEPILHSLEIVISDVDRPLFRPRTVPVESSGRIHPMPHRARVFSLP